MTVDATPAPTGPTAEQIAAQHHALLREVCAWLVANAQRSEARARVALRELRRIRADNYVLDDLDDDIAWIREHDLGIRLPVLNAALEWPQKHELLEVMAVVAAGNRHVSETDAEFIELVCRGLSIDSSEVTRAVMAALDAANLRAA